MDKILLVEDDKEIIRNLTAFLKEEGFDTDYVSGQKAAIDYIEEIDGLLGEHRRVYKDIKFTNDFHEIYCKLKSKKLVSKDYEYLFNWLGDKLNLS